VPDRRELGAIFLGGAAGALVRAGLLEAMGEGAPGWPWATFVVNVAGAFLLGYLITALPPATRRRPLLTTGFCGALTTFSTMQVELLTMLDTGRTGLAAAYGGGSIFAGLIGVHFGTVVARRPQIR
jgi:CrcB protein